MKACSECGETKPTSEFSNRVDSSDGLRGQCKACHAARKAAYRSSNIEKAKSRDAAYRAANKEKIKSGFANWYAANSEKVKSRAAKWAAANHDKCTAIKSAWKKANPEKVQAYAAANVDKKRIRHQNRRARTRESGGKLSIGLADKLFRLQRGKCACCGEPLGDDYHLDHIMPLALGGTNTDDNIQLLRSKCNLHKNAKHPVDFMQQRGFLL